MIEELTAARALVAKGWTQATYHADKFYHEYEDIPAEAREAKECFCLVGAVIEVDRPNRDDLCEELKKHLPHAHQREDESPQRPLLNWNDHRDRTQAEVLALFDKAIEGLR